MQLCGIFRLPAFDVPSVSDSDVTHLNIIRLRLRPRVLRDVSVINTSTTILGDKIDFPICVAPTAMQKYLHPDGEVATAMQR